MTFTHGVGVGWLAPSLPLLGSGSTPLESPVTIDQASWVGSLIGLGALTGNIIFGLLLDRLGRKVCMYLLAIPNIVCIYLPHFRRLPIRDSTLLYSRHIGFLSTRLKM